MPAPGVEPSPQIWQTALLSESDLSCCNLERSNSAYIKDLIFLGDFSEKVQKLIYYYCNKNLNYVCMR